MYNYYHYFSFFEIRVEIFADFSNNDDTETPPKLKSKSFLRNVKQRIFLNIRRILKINKWFPNLIRVCVSLLYRFNQNRNVT